jgi:outer membrane protein assembly factor BamA
VQSSYYIKGVPTGKYYYDLSKKGTSVLAARVQVGMTKLFQPDNPNRVPPPDHRFYSGGASSVRGWPERTLIVSKKTDVPDVTVIGGENTMIATLEWRYAPFTYDAEYTGWQKFSSPLRIVAFYDIGNAWDQGVTPFTSLAQTVGLGIRYGTPIGPLRFDWGLKLYDPSGEFIHQGYKTIAPGTAGRWLWQEPKFPANIIGQRWKDYMSFHFAIGQAF